MQQTTQARVLRIIQIALAVILIIVTIVIIYAYLNRLVSDLIIHWEDITYDIAYQMYTEDITLDMIPENSLKGFPWVYYYSIPIVISVLAFVVTKLIMRKKVLIPTICSVIALLLFVIIGSLAALNYYNNFKLNVGYEYSLNYWDWYYRDWCQNEYPVDPEVADIFISAIEEKQNE